MAEIKEVDSLSQVQDAVDQVSVQAWSHYSLTCREIYPFRAIESPNENRC